MNVPVWNASPQELTKKVNICNFFEKKSYWEISGILQYVHGTEDCKQAKNGPEVEEAVCVAGAWPG